MGTIEELDDVSEVHCVGQYHVAVGLEQRQRNEQHHVLRRHVPSRPDQLPRREHLRTVIRPAFKRIYGVIFCRSQSYEHVGGFDIYNFAEESSKKRKSLENDLLPNY